MQAGKTRINLKCGGYAADPLPSDSDLISRVCRRTCRDMVPQ
jgi:hypothetical protein